MAGREDRAPDPDRARALAQYAALAPGYDRHMRRLARLQRAAVRRLEIAPGDVVLDVACGTGLTLGPLAERVGPAGRVVGLDQSPEMLERARERVAAHGWRNVTLVRTAAQDAELDGVADGALFAFAHDVLVDPVAVERIVALLRPGASVACVGAKLAGRAQPLTNAVVRRAARPYMTTFRGLQRPWSDLERHTDGMHHRPRALGGAYVAWGRIARPAD